MAPRHQADPLLIEACRRGDQAAWDALVARYGRLVYSVAKRYGLADADAEDVFQTVFAALYRRLDDLVDASRVSSWLLTATHRECWRPGRRASRQVPLDERDVRAEPLPEVQIERWEQQQIVRECLEALGDPCKSLLEALFMNPGLPEYSSIASRLGMKVGSVGPTRVRCFRKLKALLKERGLTEPSG